MWILGLDRDHPLKKKKFFLTEKKEKKKKNRTKTEKEVSRVCRRTGSSIELLLVDFTLTLTHTPIVINTHIPYIHIVTTSYSAQRKERASEITQIDCSFEITSDNKNDYPGVSNWPRANRAAPSTVAWSCPMSVLILIGERERDREKGKIDELAGRCRQVLSPTLFFSTDRIHFADNTDTLSIYRYIYIYIRRHI
ncbi:hypothetical protein TWF751_012125 [Orbilia oligospora]|nr:hypothetical protein TWF751_012125 [Orbilia oligospora]